MFAGIEVKFKNMVYPVILAPTFIPELNAVTHTKDGEKDSQMLLLLNSIQHRKQIQTALKFKRRSIFQVIVW